MQADLSLWWSHIPHCWKYHVRAQFGLFFDTGQLYGLEKFWAFLKYSRKHIDFDPKLKEWLTKFKRLEDFRVDVSSIYIPVIWQECGLAKSYTCPGTSIWP